MPAKLIDIFDERTINECRSGRLLNNLQPSRELQYLTWNELSALGLQLMMLNKLQTTPPGHFAVYAIEELTRRCVERGVAIFQSISIETGMKSDLIQLAKPQKVGMVGGTDHIAIIEFGSAKNQLYCHPNSFIAIIQDEAELPDMPDEAEMLDRVLALAVQHGPVDKETFELLGFLLEAQVFDTARLIDLTNDLEAYTAPDVRSCRVCGCTDDDCSQCIEATGGPCTWVNEDHTLCSRCEPPMGNKAWVLEGSVWVYHKELDETPCDECNFRKKECTCK